MYIDDLILLCELFHETIGRFTVELDTNARVYYFNQDNYPAIKNIDTSERVEAMFISYHGESLYPILFMILSPSCASVNINFKYDLQFGLVDDAIAIAGKHKRAIDIFWDIRPSRAAALIIALDIIAVLAFGLTGAYWTVTMFSSIALILAVTALSFYTGRHYCEISLDEEPPASALSRAIKWTGKAVGDAVDNVSAETFERILYYLCLALVVIICAIGGYEMCSLIIH
ncbi:hypothetical protein [Methanocella paludicola]|nr:hypothetical protein [Methanocella paludicola]